MSEQFSVFLTADAQADLNDLIGYIAERDSGRAAESVLGRIEKALDSLATMPERGSHPKELLDLGIRDYRQVFFKPYRLIYRVIGSAVFVYLVVDGRRDMQSVLARRLLATGSRAE